MTRKDRNRDIMPLRLQTSKPPMSWKFGEPPCQNSALYAVDLWSQHDQTKSQEVTMGEGA